jgi:hypothetical protein
MQCPSGWILLPEAFRVDESSCCLVCAVFARRKSGVVDVWDQQALMKGNGFARELLVSSAVVWGMF